ncbi:MAG: hypothetical protein GC180_05940 [Bacteroidetes bacterium]|nr:hypothetical protein [Bacteroidota bacterium]
MPKAYSTRIPITVESIDGDGYHIFTSLYIGKVKLRALIDTGASKSVLGKDAIDILKKVELISESSSQAKGIGEQMLETTVAKVKKLRIGSFELKDIYTGVLDLSHITQTYQSIGVKPFDMILGGDILDHFQAVINYKKSWLKLRR